MTIHPSLPVGVLPSLIGMLLSAGPSFGQADPALPEQLVEALEQIDEAGARSHLYFLASDALQGRDTPSPELDLAASYLVSQFESLGLRGPEGLGFYQRVPLDTQRTMQETASFELGIGDRSAELGFPADSLQVSGSVDEELPFEAEGVVVIPRFFAEGVGTGLDLKGKVLVILQPASPPAQGERSYWGMLARSPFLLSRVFRQTGALGVVVVTQPGEVGKAYFADILGQSQKPRIGRDLPRGSRPVIVTGSAELRSMLAAVYEADEETLFASTLDAKEVAGSLVGTPARAEHLELSARNVIAVLPGSDPEFHDEYVLVSAHYDHIGSRNVTDGDGIYNGADDDASGTTALLLLARAFASLETMPKRSIALVAFCGEEKGLLGSRHFAEDPPIPLESIVANVNVEMIGRPDQIGKERAWVTGYEYSEVGVILRDAAAPLGFEVYRHERFSTQLFGASDNASLSAKGVPAHSISAGSLHDDYHQPSDEPATLDFPNLTRTVQAIFLGVHALAERDLPPRWDLGTQIGAQAAKLRPPR